MSDTPRTDSDRLHTLPADVVSSDFARELERELAALRARVHLMQKAGDAMADYLAPGPIPTAEPTERDFILARWEEAAWRAPAAGPV